MIEGALVVMGLLLVGVTWRVLVLTARLAQLEQRQAEQRRREGGRRG